MQPGVAPDRLGWSGGLPGRGGGGGGEEEEEEPEPQALWTLLSGTQVSGTEHMQGARTSFAEAGCAWLCVREGWEEAEPEGQ